MEFIVKDMDINTGGVPVAILNYQDAESLDLRHGDRILVKHNRRKAVAILDISESDKAVPKGKVGLFEEMLDKLGARHRDQVKIEFIAKPKSVQYIRNKLHGQRLKKNEIDAIIKDIVQDNLTDIEKTYFVASSYMRGLNLDETKSIAKSTLKYSRKFKFKGTLVDKHSIGGVPNNKVSMILVPIITYLGLKIPKMSSRSITGASGTADTMEVLCNVEINEKKFIKVVEETGGCLCWNVGINLVPADNKIIDVKHPLAIDVPELMVASVLAAKAAVGSSFVVIDIPVGDSAKVKNMKEAKRLEKLFKNVGSSLSLKIKCIITKTVEPVGYGVGPLFEAMDVMSVLRNEPHAPKDLKEKSIIFTDALLKMAGAKCNAREILESGKALTQMNKIIRAQGRHKNVFPGRFTYGIVSKSKRKIKEINLVDVAKIARAAGAPYNKGAGIVFHCKTGDTVRRGETIATIYASTKEKLECAKERLKQSDGI